MRWIHYALIADINFGMTLALAATSIVLYFVQSGDSDSASAQSEDNTLRLTVAPWAAPTGGGLVSQLRFCFVTQDESLRYAKRTSYLGISLDAPCFWRVEWLLARRHL